MYVCVHMHVMCIYLYKRAKQTMCLCVCAVAIITKVATRCTLGILKSLISVQQSALLVAPPLHIHTHTHTRPHFSQTILQHTFLCLAENYLLAKMLFVCAPCTLCRPSHPLCLLIAHILRSIYAWEMPCSSLLLLAASASSAGCQSVWLPEQNIACCY